MHKNEIGLIGEKYAADFLVASDYKIIAHNFQSRYGEIDLIAVDNRPKYDYPTSHEGLFVEVKTRISLRMGKPEESLTRLKVARILKTIWYFFSVTPKVPFKSWRIDLIAVILNKNKELISIEHFTHI